MIAKSLRAALFATLYSNNIVGTLGTNPTTFQSFSNAANQRLTESLGRPTF